MRESSSICHKRAPSEVFGNFNKDDLHFSGSEFQQRLLNSRHQTFNLILNDFIFEKINFIGRFSPKLLIVTNKLNCNFIFNLFKKEGTFGEKV